MKPAPAVWHLRHCGLCGKAAGASMKPGTLPQAPIFMARLGAGGPAALAANFRVWSKASDHHGVAQARADWHEAMLLPSLPLPFVTCCICVSLTAVFRMHCTGPKLVDVQEGLIMGVKVWTM